MRIVYEGTDITSHVTMARCVWEASLEGRVPRLSVEFDDDGGVWDSWAPARGERVSVVSEGAAPTGELYVTACTPKAGGYAIMADALPVPDSPVTATWADTTLFVVAAQIARRLGLAVDVHGCDDMRLAYVKQRGERSLGILALLSAVSGSFFDVFGGVLHLCGRDWAESQPAAGGLVVDRDDDFEYRIGRAYTGCRLTQTALGGARGEFSASAGADGRVLELELDGRVALPGTSELERACAGMLALCNSRASCGHARSDSLSPFTPGAVCEADCPGAPSVSGRALVERVRNDFASGSSKVWWRRL